MALSKVISTNKYGTELQNAFNKMKDRVSKSYGKPQIKDEIRNDILSSYKKDEYWFYTLTDGSRELSAIWGKDSPLADNLDFVALTCVPASGLYEGKGHLGLAYRFTNASSVEDEQDSVF